MPTVLVDFDGVVHRYSRGWSDGTAYDEPMPQARDALAYLESAGYTVVIFSSRDGEQIVAWLEQYGFPPYPVTNVKIPAVAQIDDRAVTFASWPQSINELVRRYPVSGR